MNGNSTPLIFTHFGASSYLKHTMATAKEFNPSVPMVLLGDSSNLGLANDFGWRHVMFDSLTSEKRIEFNKYYRRVEGPEHHGVRRGVDWVKFVFERFFVIETYLINAGHDRYYHFDSDTLILTDLSRRLESDRVIQLDCTTLCQDKCPSGAVGKDFLTGFCDHIVREFKDPQFLNGIQSKINPKHAYTEMWSFVNYRTAANLRTLRLSSVLECDGIWFDDCICFDDGFEMRYSESLGKKIKNFYFSEGAFFCSKNDGRCFSFASINCSWVDDRVFEWVSKCLRGDASGFLVDYLDENPALTR